jgi:hypothetical protein
MMRRALIYLGIVIFVGIFVVAIENPFESRVAKNADLPLFPDYDTDEVFFFEITQLVEGVKLKREGANWIAAEVITSLKKDLYESEGKEIPEPEWKPADKSRVVSALGSLVGLSKGILVSANIDRRELYQTGQTGVRVTALGKDKKPMFDIVVGKNGPDFTSNYVRFFESDDVYLVPRILTGIFSPRASDWIVEQ